MNELTYCNSSRGTAFQVTVKPYTMYEYAYSFDEIFARVNQYLPIYLGSDFYNVLFNYIRDISKLSFRFIYII
jgi:hypothetical protein